MSMDNNVRMISTGENQSFLAFRSSQSFSNKAEGTGEGND
jgi:hypothetical protein